MNALSPACRYSPGLIGRVLAVLICSLQSAAADESDRIATRTFDDHVFGGYIVADVAGDPAAPLVVLIHGLGDAGAADWQPVIPALANHYRVLAMDLPGFARSSKGNHRYGPREQAQAVRGLVAQHTDQPFMLVGHSMGAAIALAYADDYPGDLSRLVLVSMAGVLHPAIYSESLSRMGLREMTGIDTATNPWAELGMALATELLLNRAARLDFDPAVLLQTYWLRQAGTRGQPAAIAALALAVHDFGEALRRVEVPTTLIWGDEDEVAPLRTATVAAALIPGATLEILPGMAHAPMLEATTEFNRILLAALSGQRDGPVLSVADAVPENGENVRCSGQAQARYSGVLGQVEIDHCGRVRIENAQVESVRIDNGELELVNVDIRSGIQARNAKLILTAGTVAGTPPLTLDKTMVDAAGTHFVTDGFVAINTGDAPTTMWLSVSSRADRNARTRLIHDAIQVHDRW